MNRLILALVVTALAGCSDNQEYKCIDGNVYVKRGNFWSRVYDAMPCKPIEDAK